MAAQDVTTGAGTPTALAGGGIRSVARWLVGPAVEPVSAGQGVAMTFVRLLVGVMWLYNVAWKVPPSFGESDKGGLFAFTSYAVSNPVFPPYSWVVEHLVLPHFVPFGWGVVVAETVLAVLLLSGSYIRVAAAVGVVQAGAIGLSVARAPGEWPWSYILMAAVHLLILFGGAGRYLAVDAVRARLARGVGLGRFWGGLSTLMGLTAIAISSFGAPFGPSGVNLQLPGLEFGLGTYNVGAGIALLVAGVALLAWSFGVSRRWLLGAAAAITVLAALVTRVQIGFSPPVLGADGTSVAFFFTMAVVAIALSRAPRPGTRDAPG